MWDVQSPRGGDIRYIVKRYSNRRKSMRVDCEMMMIIIMNIIMIIIITNLLRRRISNTIDPSGINKYYSNRLSRWGLLVKCDGVVLLVDDIRRRWFPFLIVYGKIINIIYCCESTKSMRLRTIITIYRWVDCYAFESTKSMRVVLVLFVLLLLF